MADRRTPPSTHRRAAAPAAGAGRVPVGRDDGDACVRDAQARAAAAASLRSAGARHAPRPEPVR